MDEELGRAYGYPTVLAAASNVSDFRWVALKSVQSAEHDVCFYKVRGRRGTSPVYTVYGAVVGKPCVFPFVYEGREQFGCVRRGRWGEVCSTRGNLDRFPDHWGTCPPSWRGAVGWSVPDYQVCDRPCGRGRVHRAYICPTCLPLRYRKTNEACNPRVCTGERVLATGGHSRFFVTDDLLNLIDPLKVGAGLPISECVFPWFDDDGSSRESCLVDPRHPQGAWCSLTANYALHRRWALCLDAFKGMWSSWTVASGCSASCGRGTFMLRRKCRYPPCRGQSTGVGGECNLRPCPECFDSRGVLYRGRLSVANDGRRCMSWTEPAPGKPVYSTVLAPELDNSYCRNPRDRKLQPYCYLADRRPPRFMYCDLQPCDLPPPGLLNQSAIYYTIPLSDRNGSSGNPPCRFPFLHRRFAFGRCADIGEDRQAVGRQKCAVIEADEPTLAYCPRSLAGTWSSWSWYGDCSVKCGGGWHVRHRTCLLDPCQGPATELSSRHRCSMQPCIYHPPGQDRCFTGRGVLYNATVTVSLSGKACLPWRDSAHHWRLDHLPANLCRNPEPAAYLGPWCYVDDPLKEGASWEYCDAPRCVTDDDQIYGLTVTGSSIPEVPKLCVFPFYTPDNRSVESCQTYGAHSLRYCGLDGSEKRYNASGGVSVDQLVESGIVAGIYGVCPRSTAGAWSSWTSVSPCSRVCGSGGTRTHTRVCRNEPCPASGASAQVPCNEFPCQLCLRGTGEDYQGGANRNGTCMPWPIKPTSATPYSQRDHPQLEANRCRNPPGSLKKLPWCYTNNSGTIEQKYCEPEHCLDPRAQFVPYTFSATPDNIGLPCHAPYTIGNNPELYVHCQPDPADPTAPARCPVIVPATNATAQGDCPERYRGRWSAWRETGACSQACGVGDKQHVRECLSPPCVGSKFKYEGMCNAHACQWASTMARDVDCYVGTGVSYVGDVATTVSGKTCQRWDATAPNSHAYVATGAGIDLSDNRCRNPSPYHEESRTGPWCFTTDPGTRWEYCAVPRCRLHEGEIRAVLADAESEYCEFPFHLNGAKTEACADADAATLTQLSLPAGSKVCSSNGSALGLCPSQYQGSWSAWAIFDERPCSHSCQGRLVYRRVCRYPPCGTAEKQKLGEPCNPPPCRDQCYAHDGHHYVGAAATAVTGAECIAWSDVMVPGGMIARPERVVEAKNHCRNPSEDFQVPWCFVREAGGAEVPKRCAATPCPEQAGDVITTGGGGGQPLRKCVFPFLVSGVLKYRCVAEASGGTRFYCGTANGTTDVRAEGTWGYCDEEYVGTWSPWRRDGCSLPCGGGREVEVRTCRYPPCRGESRRLTDRCNRQACQSASGWCSQPSTPPLQWCHDADYSVTVKRQSDGTRFACVFPFTYGGDAHQSCVDKPAPSPALYPPEENAQAGFWCMTDPTSQDWGYCSDADAERWRPDPTAASTCSPVCSSHRVLQCSKPPCSGSPLDLVWDQPCAGCKPEEEGEWGAWSACSDTCESVRTRRRVSCFGNRPCVEAEGCPLSDVKVPRCRGMYASRSLSDAQVNDALLGNSSPPRRLTTIPILLLLTLTSLLGAV
ncbi:MAG: fibronectin type II domain-containing protein [Planctomycetota bacterium]